ncbi:DEAD/DEAH box helicase family protein, partial [Rhodovulum adriaticum]|uniref:DEAD/DEAH box helicase family protein n=1 Tax=Rhodovulum adriaticum TaxID=35804 RepID=UPI001905301F
PKSMQEFNEAFVFRWSDRKNRKITEWKEIVKEFLRIPMAHQMVGDYLVIDNAEEIENQRHMLLRPYQVHAIQAIEHAAFGSDNEEKEPHGGFIWHTTGSGKTITSFKSALLLSTRTQFEKVVFLLDRKELDRKTGEDFKAYAEYEGVAVDSTKYTSNLKKYIKDSGTGII